ncbi:MAG: TlpA family protein disulfide reductase [Ignavibacteriales bacterium]|nr:TlpA family protein disulfide reductase [Ignavibacteriales bacterium]
MKLIAVFILLNIIPFQLLAQKNIEVINKQILEKIIYERNGKVLLLNIWATWCVPCREEFSDLVKVASEFGKQNVEVIGISIDFPEDIKSKVIPFLEKQKANFANYVSTFKNDEELINFINEDWNGALPATAIFDTTGKQVAFLNGKRNYDEFVSELKKNID